MFSTRHKTRELYELEQHIRTFIHEPHNTDQEDQGSEIKGKQTIILSIPYT